MGDLDVFGEQDTAVRRGGKDRIEALGQALEAADAVIVGAGAGLSPRRG